MSSFKIQFEGLEFLKKNLSTNSALSHAIPDVSIAILQFHNVLEKRVSTLYTLTDSLDSVRIGHSVQPSQVGNTFLRYSLQYRSKPVPLTKYKYVENAVSSDTARYPRRMPSGNINWVYKGYALQVKTEIRTNSPKIAKRGKGNYRYKGFLQNGKVYARMQKATWSSFPTKFSNGVRAPYVELFGPTLANLAESTYDKDPIVQAAKDRVGEVILEAFTDWYAK
jgi:hypothetical protein